MTSEEAMEGGGRNGDLITRLKHGDRALGVVVPVSGGGGAREEVVGSCDEDKRFEERESFDRGSVSEIRP